MVIKRVIYFTTCLLLEKVEAIDITLSCKVSVTPGADTGIYSDRGCQRGNPPESLKLTLAVESYE